MFSYEDRFRAVRLYIKLGKRLALTIRQLGYPTKNALKSWHREYEQHLDLPAGYVRVPKYSQAQKERAVEHYLEHGRCLSATIQALGYPSRTLLPAWIQELHPETRTRVVGRSQELTTSMKQPRSSRCACDKEARSQWPKIWACRVHRCTSGRISYSATTRPHP